MKMFCSLSDRRSTVDLDSICFNSMGWAQLSADLRQISKIGSDALPRKGHGKGRELWSLLAHHRQHLFERRG